MAVILSQEEQDEVNRILAENDDSDGPGDLTTLSEENPDAPDGTDVE